MREEVRLSQGLAVLELNVMAAGTKRGKTSNDKRFKQLFAYCCCVNSVLVVHICIGRWGQRVIKVPG